MDDKKQPIVVKKVHKGGHGHHGGAWKVAMADFAIAMMAFFMVMWLLGGTTVEQKAAIAEYFNNPSLTDGKSQTAVQGQTGPGGAATSVLQLGGTMELPKGDGQKSLEKSHDKTTHDESHRPNKSKTKPAPFHGDRQQKMMLHALSASINKALSKKALAQFKDQVIIDISDEGLRIQIVDKENRPMFDLGSSQLKPYTRELLHEIALMVDKTSSRISVTGHTDAIPYVSRADYSNWELSSDRAHSARRAMLEVGLSETKIARVVGLSSTVLFDEANPSHPTNRRISIVFLNQPQEESKKPVAAKQNPKEQKAVVTPLNLNTKETPPTEKITTLPIIPPVDKQKLSDAAPPKPNPEKKETLPTEKINTLPITQPANKHRVNEVPPPIARPSPKTPPANRPFSEHKEGQKAASPPAIKPAPIPTNDKNFVVPPRTMLPNTPLPPIELPQLNFDPVIDPNLLPGR